MRSTRALSLERVALWAARWELIATDTVLLTEGGELRSSIVLHRSQCEWERAYSLLYAARSCRTAGCAAEVGRDVAGHDVDDRDLVAGVSRDYGVRSRVDLSEITWILRNWWSLACGPSIAACVFFGMPQRLSVRCVLPQAGGNTRDRPQKDECRIPPVAGGFAIVRAPSPGWSRRSSTNRRSISRGTCGRRTLRGLVDFGCSAHYNLSRSIGTYPTTDSTATHSNTLTARVNRQPLPLGHCSRGPDKGPDKAVHDIETTLDLRMVCLWVAIETRALITCLRQIPLLHRRPPGFHG